MLRQPAPLSAGFRPAASTKMPPGNRMSPSNARWRASVPTRSSLDSSGSRERKRPDRKNVWCCVNQPHCPPASAWRLPHRYHPATGCRQATLAGGHRYLLARH